MINVSDPFLRKIIQDALAGGNTSLGNDLEPGKPTILPRPMPGMDLGLGGSQAMLGQPPLPGGTPPPRGPQPSILDRMLSGLYVPPAPSMHGYEKDRASRMFLSGLTGAIAKNHGGPGYGSSVLGAISGRNGGNAGASPHEDPNNDLKRAYLQAQIDAAKALGATRQARTNEINQPDDKVDPFVEDKHALYGARTHSFEALAKRRERPDQPRASGGGGKRGAGSNRAQLSARFQAKVKEMTARVAAIGATNGWTPEEIKAAQQRQVARLADEYSALLTGDNTVEETPAYGDAGRTDRYTKPTKGAKVAAPANETFDQYVKRTQAK